MKKWIMTGITALCTLQAGAQLSGDGFYRVQNQKSGRYISVRDNYSDKSRTARGDADVAALWVMKNFNEVVSDPSTIIYISHQSAGYVLESQGCNTYSLTGMYLSLKDFGGNMYGCGGSYQGVKVYLKDKLVTSAKPTETISWQGTETGTYNYWYCLPVSATTDNYFGLLPSVAAGGKYYAPFYAAFPFTTASTGMKVYYVKQIDKELGVAVYAEATGTVPASAGVFVECSSQDPSANRLNIQPKGTGTALAGNKLTGIYFDNIYLVNGVSHTHDKGGHSNYTKYTDAVANTTRLLRTNSQGKLVYKKVAVADMPITTNAVSPTSSDRCLPRNEAYLTVSTDTPDELVLMTESEYTTYKQQASAVTLQADNKSRLYGDANPTLTYTVTEGAKQGGEPTLSCAATATSPVGTYDIVIAKGAVSNGTVNLKNGKLTVTQAPLTVTARSYTIKQNEALPTFAATYAGWKNGETEAVLTTKPTFTCNVPAAKTPGTYPITVSGAAAQNYAFTYVAGTLTIQQADPITITAKDATMTYGDAVPQLTYEVTGGTLTGTPKLTCTATSTSDVGTYDIIVSTEGIDYPNLKTVNGKLTISKAPVTVTAANATISETDALPTFTATYSGFKNSQTEAVLTKAPTFACTPAAAEIAFAKYKPGTYDIVPQGAEAKNYSFTYAKGTLTVTALPTITVKANDATMVYGDEVPELTKSVSGGTLTPDNVSITTSVTKTTAVGTYDIVVARGESTYPRLAFENGKLTVTKAPLTAAAGTYTMKETDGWPTFKATYTGFRNGDTEAVVTKQPTFAGVPTTKTPGEYELTLSGAEAQNYVFTYQAGKLVISAADEITITVKDVAIVYGQAVPTTFEYEVTGGTVEGQPAITCAATADSGVGQYDITIAAGTITYPQLRLVGAKLTISPATVTVSAGTYTMKQTDQRPTFKATYEGWQKGETEAVLTKQPTFSTTAPADNAPGEYTVKVEGAEAANYTFTYVDGTLTIREADLITITAQNATMVYGDDVPQLTLSIEGGTLSGTQPTVTCAATSRSDVGTYAITVSTDGITYPNLKTVDGTLTVTPAPLTVAVGTYERFEGEENPVFELTYTGWRNGDTDAVLTQKPVATTTATASSPAGEYTIEVTGGEAKNYTLTYQNGKLIVKEGQGIAEVRYAHPVDVYTLSGRKVRSQATTLKDLPAGVYVVEGRKVTVRTK